MAHYYKNKLTDWCLVEIEVCLRFVFSGSLILDPNPTLKIFFKRLTDCSKVEKTDNSGVPGK